MQKRLQNNPKKKKQPYECHLPPTLLVHSQPHFATHLPLPLRYNGSSPEGPSVRANNRKNTKVGIQTSPLFYSTVLFCPVVSPLSNSCIFITLEKKTDPDCLIQPRAGPQRSAVNICVYVCACICVSPNWHCVYL